MRYLIYIGGTKGVVCFRVRAMCFYKKFDETCVNLNLCPDCAAASWVAASLHVHYGCRNSFPVLRSHVPLFELMIRARKN